MNKLIKTFLVALIIITSLSQHSFGQNFILSPSDSVVMEYDASSFGSNDITIVNQTMGSLTFKWRLVSNTLLSGWDKSLCDLGACYPVIPDSSIMTPTDPGGNAFFIFHTFFNGVAGTGALELFVFEVGDEANGKNVYFEYTATGSTAIDDKDAKSSNINIYPNPIEDVITVSLSTQEIIKDVEIVNVLGETIAYQIVDEMLDNIQIHVSHLQPGAYFIIINQEEGIRTVRKLLKVN
ncbi:MAG: T9SS type A sorting domain-containing protein [Bacteroidetes bacterium]|nr:T9SS type A sorting domain-containing protein [Bacteroidota bacterium]